ncbi:MAG: hypothetical protein ACLQPD_25740 [Desulfomonilaceae bacterium]
MVSDDRFRARIVASTSLRIAGITGAESGGSELLLRHTICGWSIA